MPKRSTKRSLAARKLLVSELRGAHPSSGDVAEFAVGNGGELEKALMSVLATEKRPSFAIVIDGERYDEAAAFTAAGQIRTHLTWAFREDAPEDEDLDEFALYSRVYGRILREDAHMRAALDGAIDAWAAAREGSDARAMKAAVAASLLKPALCTV